MNDREEGTDRQVGTARRLLAEVSNELSGNWIATANELLDAGEPNEALLQIAWGLAERGVPVPASVVRQIERDVTSVRELPPGFSALAEREGSD
jgi:hypothetical protein